MIHWMLCVASLMAPEEAVTQVKELGPVRIITTLDPPTPTIGDEITLEIRVESEQGVDVLMPEFGEALNRYTILDFVPRRRIADNGNSIASQRYTLQPYLSGPQSIPPILIEFIDNRPGQKPAPDDLDAYELLTDRIDFQVQSVLPENASGKLNPPLAELELIAEGTRATWWAWWLGGPLAALSGLVALMVWWQRRRRRVRRRNAYEVARTRLDKLLSRGAPRDEKAIEEFFVDISAIIRRYLEDRFDLRAPELTTEEFLAVAGTSGVLSAEHQRVLRDFLRQADLIKFAGVRAGAGEIRTSSDLAIRFLEETRENAPWVELTDDSDGGTGISEWGTPPVPDQSHSLLKEKADV